MDLLKDRISRFESQGTDIDMYSSVIKYWEMEHMNRRHELATLLLEERGVGWSGELWAEEDRRRVRGWLFGRATRIGGGTSEMMLNILAKRALRLPSA